MTESLDTGHCFFLIPSQCDRVVYECFRKIAQRWRTELTGQSLSVASDVPFAAGLTDRDPPAGVRKILAANSDLITELVLAFAGLKLCYVRSGGQGPALYRQSYFDEIKIECNGPTSLDQKQLEELAKILCEELDAQGVSGTPEFASLTEMLPLRVRSFSTERRP